MFDHLVESRPQRERSLVQTIASIALHTVIIAVSIQLTRAAAEIVAKPPVETPMLFTAARTLPAVKAPSIATTPTIGPAPVATPLPLPLTVPLAIAPPTSSETFDPGRFTHRTGPEIHGIDEFRVADGSPSAVFTLQQVDEPARYLSGPQPTYPPALRRLGTEGSVVLRFVVGADGRVEENIEVISSSQRLFEEPATDAIRASRFEPARHHGAKVRQLVEQTVRFVMQ